MPPPAPAPPPWKLAIPEGRKDAAARIRDAVNSAGEYYLEEQDGTWLVERRRDPPALWRELDWKIHRFGETGSRQALLDHLDTWSTIPGGNHAEADSLVRELEKRDKPADAVKWAEVARYASDALMTAPASSMASIAERIAKKLLEWFPNGQMVIWGKNSNYMSAGRPAHLIAGAGLLGLEQVAEALETNKGGVWFRGEDIVHAHEGALYVNLVNSTEMPGWAFETIPATFIFEFWINITVHPSLDFMSIRYLNSLPVLDYLPGDLPEESPIIQPGFMEQDELRRWFIAGINRLADQLIRWENFTSSSGELRPIVHQETNMTVARILNTTAQLLASEERSSRLMAFWDLIDLYDGLVGQNIPRLVGQRFWNEQVMPACATLPSNLGNLFTRYGNELYQEWVDQCIQGITTPSRVFSSTVQLADSAQPILHSQYFARHIRARRNSLHGYNLRTGDNLALLAIHDGSLPQRLPEWGRIMLMALLTDPTIFLAKFRRIRD